MSETLANLLHETRRFPPPAELAAEANVDRQRLRGRRRRPARLLGAPGRPAALAPALGPRCSTGPTRRSRSGSSAAQLNVAYNCLDRHVEAGHGDQVAIHWEGEPGDTRTITYADLHRSVCQAANALLALGVQPATGSPSTCR